MQKGNTRSGVIKEVNRPLGFYVLALLIVGGFLTVNGISAKTVAMQYFCIVVGVLLFIVLVALVTHMTIHHHEKLTFRPEDYNVSELLK